MSQQTFFVDATGVAAMPLGAQRKSSLTAAANAAQPGSTILIQGLVDETTGEVLGYSEQPWFPYQQIHGAETFPIQLRAGVTVKPANSTQVYLWSTIAGTALIEVQPPVDPTTALTRIEDLTMIGCGIGVQVHQSGGDPAQILLKDLELVRNGIGASFVVESADMSTEVRGCTIADFSIVTPMTPPFYQPQSIGLRFEATDAGAPAGNLAAGVYDLNTSGDFSNMAPLPWRGFSPDLETEHGITGCTRLIEVFASGVIKEHPGAPAVLDPVDISDVDLAIQGGVFHGRDSSTGGWDVGVYGAAWTVLSGTPMDYRAGFRILCSGTEIRDCKLAGILGTTWVNARGRIEASAQTSIHRTGFSATHTSDDSRYSGVHLFGSEGYLAFLGSNGSSHSNRGNGIWVNANAETVPHHLPQGVFLGLFRYSLHLNDGNGLALRAANSFDGTGVAGGTAHYTDLGGVDVRNLADEGEAFQANVGAAGTMAMEFGQGRVDRCAISNNGEAGIYAHSKGTFNDLAQDSVSAVLNCRFSNSFIWNNPRAAGAANDGGLIVELEPRPAGQPTDLRGLCLMPVTQCTFANNGGTASHNVEFEDGSDAMASQFFGRYSWLNNDPYMATALYDSIFFRDIPSYFLNDFGDNLESDIAEYDAFPGGLVDPFKVGIAGIRAKSLRWSGDSKSNDSTPLPFISFNPNALDPSGMFLNPSAINIGLFRDNTANYLQYGASETNKDYSGDTRPSVASGLRDKGGEDL